nr:putative pre-16S rRNA nuclease isoform X2 [Ipomoea batatas]
MQSVEMLLKPLNLHPVQSKTIVDKFAAVEILQGYLDYVNRNEKMKLSATSDATKDIEEATDEDGIKPSVA